ncbi:MAG: SagB/ThcOx family dehydrogenase [Bacteroidales bacterium]
MKKIILILFGLLFSVIAISMILKHFSQSEKNQNSIQMKIRNSDSIFIELPSPKFSGTMSVEEALLKRRSVREYKDTCLTLAEVSQMLWAAYGISDSVKSGHIGLHTAPSAGALYPLEIYLVAGNVSGLEAGIYRYIPKGHKLLLEEKGDKRAELRKAAWGQEMIKEAPASLVYSAVFERTTSKYSERGRQRYVCMDLGHSGENVYLQATAMGMGTCAVGAFEDKKVAKVIGLPDDEEPLYIMPLGKLISK